ncbi:hypothetical protein [Mycobacteroides chelonae]|uniref:hypothetical protein n=1 Tax=Mycobacteroides chelonae TaxID=1774 RepID=UPI003568D7FA
MNTCVDCARVVEALEWASCAYEDGTPLDDLIFGAVQRCGPYEIAPTPWPTNDDGSDAWTVSYGLSEIGRYPSISTCRWAAESHLHAGECPHVTPLISRKPWWKSFFT